jgi:ATP-dependent helicase/nuclease subunit B
MLGLRDPVEIGMHPDNRDFGEILHAILFTFHRVRPAQRDDDIVALGEICDRSFAPLLTQRPALIATRQRLRNVLPGYVAWLHQSEDEGWHWAQGEFAARRELEIGDGRNSVQVILHGRIDRLDRDSNGNRRILDYKARSPDQLRRNLRTFGEEVQLHFYGLLAEPPVAQAAYASVRPLADRSDPPSRVVHIIAPPGDFAGRVVELQARIRADLQRAGEGAPMPANGVEEICRRCELRGLCRHAYVRSPGNA